jgi:hypothetical protein
MTRVDWDCTLETWRDLLPLCREATFFHTPEWYMARAAAGRVRLSPVHFRFDDGTPAVLPLAVVRRYRGLVWEACAGLDGGYGGLVAPRPLRPAQIEEAYRLVRRRHQDLTVMGNPFATRSIVPTAAEVTMDYTQVVDLLPRTAQEHGFSEMRRHHVKAARKAGVRIEVHHGLKPSQAATVYPIYAQHASGWKYTKWLRDEAYFESLFAHAGHHLALFSAYQDDTLLGFHLVACYPTVAIQLHLTTDSAYNRLHAASLLVAEALAWCHENGLKAFDFLASGQLDGVRLFKASFGAQPHSYPIATHHGWLDQSLRTVWQLTRNDHPPLAPAT